VRYALLTYNPPGGHEIWAAMTESERQAEEDEYVRLVEAMHASNAYVDASEFDPSTGPRTVRVRNGDSSVSDGPAIQGEEVLTGYFLIDVESEDAAIDWAARIPNARSGSVEVRRVDEGELADRMSAASGGAPD
jgi:hypothetical protein